MRRYKTIIVTAALDSRDATTLEHASFFARAAKSAKVHVAHVVPESDVPPELAEKFPELKGPSPDQVIAKLKASVEGRKLLPDETAVEYWVRKGPLHLEIAKLAAELKADLVTFSRLAREAEDPVGNLALKVLRGSPCSTFILPEGSKPRYQKVLVAIDFSRHSHETVDVGFALASTAGDSEVTVLHVYSVPAPAEGGAKASRGLSAAAKKYVEKQWAELQEGVNTRGIPWKVRFEASADVPQVIVSAADEIGADLIVMSSHGRTTEGTPILGHVPELVSTMTERPLFCVKRPGEVVGLLKALMQFLSLKSKD